MISESDNVRVDKAVQLLTDDWARQSGYLSIDDVTRIFVRLSASAAESSRVLQELESKGIELAGGPDGSVGAAVVSGRVRMSAGNVQDAPYPDTYISHDLLSHHDEIRLSRRVQAALSISPHDGADSDPHQDRISEAGGRARTTLVLANLRLVIHCAKEFRSYSELPLDDLIQDGIIGLMRAVEKYDPEKGYRFSTYATWWIRQAITRALCDRGRTIRLPAHIHDQLRNLRRKRASLALVIGRAPTLEDLAKELGCSYAEVALLTQVERDASSFETDDKNSRLRLAIRERAGPPTESPTTAAEQDELSSLITEVLKTLDKRSRFVVIHRFGLKGFRPRTLEQIGRKLRVTRERVRQIEKKAVARIAATHRALLLKSYAE